jgi:hypothetical protein
MVERALNIMRSLKPKGQHERDKILGEKEKRKRMILGHSIFIQAMKQGGDRANN